MGQREEALGHANVGTAGDYFTRLLRAGRTDTALTAAPAVNAELAGADAARRREAAVGTGRMGGTVESDREAGTRSQSDVANIINENLVGGRREGAIGLERVGSQELSTASNLLGLGTRGIEDILGNATESRKTSLEQQQATGAAIGQALLSVAGFFA